MPRKVIIVGGVAGGASAAARLRRLDENAEIILLEKGAYISYANCGLPYYIGDVITDREELLVMTPELMQSRFAIDIRTEHEMLALDPQNQRVEIKNHQNGEVYFEDYTELILSPGSKPLRPPIPGIDLDGIFTLWTIPDTDAIMEYIAQHQPKKALVIGGGFIGIEMAENLYHRGMDVSIVEMLDQVMAPVDYDMAQILHQHMRELGVKLYLSSPVKGFEQVDGQLIARVGDDETVEADLIILSLGVRPQTEFLKDSGLEFGPRGHIIVDEHLATNIPGVYAVGDAIEVRQFTTQNTTSVPLAGPANKQGRMVADNIVLESKKSYLGSQGTSIAKVFEMSVAGTGLNEKNLQAQGLEYNKDYAVVMIGARDHAGYYPDAIEMQLKATFSLPEGKLLGAQVVGFDGVDKRIDAYAIVQRMGGTIYDLTELELAYAPPYNSAKDPINMLGFVAENILAGMVELVTPMHLAQEPQDFEWLDLREPDELLLGGIEGSRHIPLGELRDQLSTLDPEKAYVLYCARGTRSYIGTRILLQHGFKQVRSLSGGLPAWKSFQHQASDVTPLPPSVESPAYDPDTPADITLDVSGAQCPGPILQVAKALAELQPGQRVAVKSTDPGFYRDIPMWCERTSNTLAALDRKERTVTATIIKGQPDSAPKTTQEIPHNKTMVVFSGDLDKAIASLIIANGAASMGRKVTMFFTFWGLNILRRPEKVTVQKPFIQKAFGAMMPRGTKKLGLSRMNFLGAGAKLIRKIMRDNHVDSLESLLQQAQANGVKMIACNMSMELMGITEAELLPGIELGGVATYLGEAEMADTNLFI